MDFVWNVFSKDGEDAALTLDPLPISLLLNLLFVLSLLVKIVLVVMFCFVPHGNVIWISSMCCFTCPSIFHVPLSGS